MIDLSPMTTAMATLRASWRHFGLGQTLLQAGMLGVVAAGRTTMLLDRLFQPGYRKVKIERPVFIVGAPRSGTTFIHRLLTSTDEYPHWMTWEMFAPSLTVRRLVRPLVPWVIKLLGQGFADDSTLFIGEGHKTTATSIEEEEVLFLLRMDTQFVKLFTPVAFDPEDRLDLVYNDRQAEARRAASAKFLIECFKRQVYLTKRPQILAKMPYSTLRVRTLYEAFPDARFVYMVRSPFETLRSHMSLHLGFFQSRYGAKALDSEKLAHYWDRRYRYNVALYRYFEEVVDEGIIPADQLFTLRYPELRADLTGVVNRMAEHIGMPLSDALRARVAEAAAQQAAYKRMHHNMELEQFGIDRQRVVDDLGDVFEKYGFPTQ